MNLHQSVILGAVEGITEFLPVSSTGHLILASAWMGLQGEAVKTFDVVIQAGALAAVLGLYGRRLGSLPLLRNLVVGFLPAGVAGLLLHRWVKEHLFGTHPVAVALAVGGLFMIGLDRWWLRREEAAPFPAAGTRPPRSWPGEEPAQRAAASKKAKILWARRDLSMGTSKVYLLEAVEIKEDF